ncbi:MAG: hypothetical protein WDN03_09330 [Rhizomicrobium sp.]
MVIATEFLDTLELRELQSGVGEMLKVHIVDGPRSFDRIDAAYDAIFADRAVMLAFIRASLEIKKRLIEIDEFDRGPRNLMNYGHSFGHAIEAATEFAVPHGIAVTIGADMANYVAVRLGRMSEDKFRHMHPVLRKNYRDYASAPVPIETFIGALGRDKKNLSGKFSLILPNRDAVLEKVDVPQTDGFRDFCIDFFDTQRSRA